MRSRPRLSIAVVTLCAVVLVGVVVALGPGRAPAPPQPTSPPREPVPAGAVVRTVDSIPALLDALADDRVDEIVVADGTYAVAPASDESANSLWIGDRFAKRTRPVTVRAETRGGVTFDGGGSTYFGGISFQDGAHDQTWDGFVFANGRPTDTGVVVFGGYKDGGPPPHHITLRSITLTGSLIGTPPRDQGIYVSDASPDGPHHLLFEDIHVDGTGGLASAVAFGHDWGFAAHDVVIRRLTVNGTDQAIILWSTPPLRDITVDGATITNSTKFAVRYEADGAPFERIVLTNVASSGSREGGFFSSDGSQPAGLTFTNDQLQ